jgi:methylmalonyl-CoA/ethylmalonyl-CoA epimerase
MTLSSAKRIHHIDFVVHDLNVAIPKYESVLGLPAGPRERLASRGIDLVRFRVGETWIILVQPVRKEGPVAKFLDRHGEGFFHIAFEVDDVDAAVTRLEATGIRVVERTARRGVEGWKLVDIHPGETFGAMLQLAETTER